MDKNNPQLLKDINDALTAMKADGEYEKIYRKWFGRAP
ncbi:MAG: transporter substrate-binding domain-containing protein [Duodenibacillus sp.]